MNAAATVLPTPALNERDLVLGIYQPILRSNETGCKDTTLYGGYG